MGPLAEGARHPLPCTGTRRTPALQVTADLDVVQREEFLKFLYNESTLRGATIVYTTHIFEGLDGWPTQIIFLNSETLNVEAVHHFTESSGGSVLEVREPCVRAVSIVALRRTVVPAVFQRATRVACLNNGEDVCGSFCNACISTLPPLLLPPSSRTRPETTVPSQPRFPLKGKVPKMLRTTDV